MGFDLGTHLGIVNWPPRCPACTAPLDRRREKCEYCGIWVQRVGPVRVEPPAADEPPPNLKKPLSRT